MTVVRKLQDTLHFQQHCDAECPYDCNWEDYYDWDSEVSKKNQIVYMTCDFRVRFLNCRIRAQRRNLSEIRIYFRNSC